MMYSRYCNSIDLYDIIQSFKNTNLSIIITNDEKYPLISADKSFHKSSSKTSCHLKFYPNRQIFIKSYSNSSLTLKPVLSHSLNLECDISDLSITSSYFTISRLKKLNFRISQFSISNPPPAISLHCTTSLVFALSSIKSAILPGGSKEIFFPRLKELSCLSSCSKPSNCFILSNPRSVPSGWILNLKFSLEPHSSNTLFCCFIHDFWEWFSVYLGLFI